MKIVTTKKSKITSEKKLRSFIDVNLAISKNKMGSPAKTKALFRKVLEFC